MAKLSGVKTVDMVNGEITKVAYDGAEYVKAEGKAQVGDIVQAKKTGLDVTEGGFYEVVSVETTYVTVRDNIGDRHDFGSDMYSNLFRKAPATLETKDEALTEQPIRFSATNPPKVGETVQVLLAEGETPVYHWGYVKNGEIGVVATVKEDVCYVDFPSQKRWTAKYHELVKVAEKPSEVIAYKGAKYELVSRKAQPGDVVVPTATNSDYFTDGKVYGPVNDRIEVLDNDGDYLPVYSEDTNRTIANVKVYAPVAAPNKSAYKVGDYIVALPEADSRYAITNTKMKLAKVTGLVVEHIKIEIVAYSDATKVGEVGEVGYDYHVEPKYFRKATDEEVSAVIAPKPAFKVGDYAKLISAEYYTLVGFKTGDLVEIVENEHGEDDVDYRVKKFGSDLAGFVLKSADYISKATAEEIAQAKVGVVFAKIGRKHNEFKKGDIVRVVDSPCALPDGTIFEVKGFDSDGDMLDYKRYCYGPRHVELIAPAESRVDGSGANV